jgi:hypothetical protein
MQLKKKNNDVRVGESAQPNKQPPPSDVSSLFWPKTPAANLSSTRQLFLRTCSRSSSQTEVAPTSALHLLFYLLFLGHSLFLHHVIHGLGDSTTKALKEASYRDGRDGQTSSRWADIVEMVKRWWQNVGLVDWWQRWHGKASDATWFAFLGSELSANKSNLKLI